VPIGGNRRIDSRPSNLAIEIGFPACEMRIASILSPRWSATSLQRAACRRATNPATRERVSATAFRAIDDVLAAARPSPALFSRRIFDTPSISVPASRPLGFRRQIDRWLRS